jgi:hypothetical protein
LRRYGCSPLNDTTPVVFVKPDSASAGVANPATARLPNTSKATTSIRTHSVMKSTMAIASMLRTMRISRLMAHSSDRFPLIQLA